MWNNHKTYADLFQIKTAHFLSIHHCNKNKQQWSSMVLIQQMHHKAAQQI